MAVKDLTAYTLLRDEKLTGIKAQGKLLKHKKSGARILLIENDDKNKVFNIGFRTPPADSTGVPHIMEHSVLCGSKNFPAKDPFVELVKGSLNTFLNAMTYPDKTVYPVASCNDKDFQNLMHVYMDAVFYPNIYEHDEIFRQEGWSYKLESPEAPLEISGVVYNEMKGAFSSPEGVMDRVILNTLFPDTSYANESGGDPDVIPNLTYEQFQDFHRKYYHPVNSYIYLYGDMDMEEKLRWLDEEYLSHYDAIELDSEIKMQEPFAEMVEKTIQYSITSEESEEDNTFLTYTKVIDNVLNRELYQAFDILDYVLISSPGALIRKALTDAGIGADITGGYDNGTLQPTFQIAAKNANKEQKDEFLKVIREVLEGIVRDGIDPKAVEAAINYNEFRYREADFGHYPKGLMYGLQVMDSWLYDENEPFMHIEALETYEFLRSKIGTDYYENLIQKYLLDNQHGAVVIVEPEKGRSARLDAEFDAKLQAYKESLSKEEIDKLVERTHQLVEYQEAEEDPAVLEKIPLLERKDLSAEIDPVMNEEMELAGIPVVYHEVETNGIGYLDLMFELKGIKEEDLPYVSLLAAAMGIVDTENYSYGELANEVNVHTGGVGYSIELYEDVEAKEKSFCCFFEIHSKALYIKQAKAFELIREVLATSKLDDTERLKEILDILKSRAKSRTLTSGHSVSMTRALSYASPVYRFKDLISNVEYYRALKRILKNYDTEKDVLVEKFDELSKKIFRPENLLISYTSGREGLEGMAEEVESLKSVLSEEPVTMDELVLHCEKKNEGFKTASKVLYVCRAGNFVTNGASYHGALRILKVILGYDYLWQNVRVKNGAYGVMCGFGRTGESYFVSYRDPKLSKTMKIYEGVADYLRNFDVSDRDMTKYIIGAMSEVSTPMTPNTQGARSMNLYLCNITMDRLKRERMEVLEATQADIRALADVIDAMMKAEQICVVGGEEKIERFKDMFMEVTTL